MIETRSRPTIIVDAVMTHSRGRWDRQIVAGLVNESLETFASAPVQQFVEVLVEKGVTDELRRIDGHEVTPPTWPARRRGGPPS